MNKNTQFIFMLTVGFLVAAGIVLAYASTALSTNVVRCQDSDGGITPDIAGHVTTLTGTCYQQTAITSNQDTPTFNAVSPGTSCQRNTYHDYCSVNMQTPAVNEYYCDGNQPKLVQEYCAHACVEGACVCIPEWVCANPGVCENGTAACLEWQDLNACGVPYEGDDTVPCTPDHAEVLVVVAIDTETYQLSNQIFSQPLDLSNFETGHTTAYTEQVMDPASRNNYLDSQGSPIRYSWFLMTAEPYCQSFDGDCLTVYDALLDNWAAEIGQWGDDLQLHYHNYVWSDRDGDGIFYWNQNLVFDQANLEKMLNQLLIERSFFPTMYRGGWTWENNALSQFLNNVMPFDFSSFPPLQNQDVGNDPVGNIYDWSRAPTTWGWYHPSPTDYQTPGDSNRRMFTCRSYTEFNRELDTAFQTAKNENRKVVVCDYLHNTAYMIPHLNSIYNELLAQSAAEEVPFRYVTASQAAREAIGTNDTTAPELTLSLVQEDTTATLHITSSETLYSNPYVAIKTGTGAYLRTLPVATGTQEWEVVLDPAWEAFTLAVGATDPSGNAATAFYTAE